MDRSQSADGKPPPAEKRNESDIPKVRLRGIDWLRKAAQSGSAEAQHELEICLLTSSEDENDLRDWFDAFVDRMNASIPLNADISGSSYEATRGVAWQSEDKGELP
ncbi:MAG: hypothetical protein ACLT47_05660 [Sutterella wadsworthensis]